MREGEERERGQGVRKGRREREREKGREEGREEERKGEGRKWCLHVHHLFVLESSTVFSGKPFRLSFGSSGTVSEEVTTLELTIII